MTSIEKSIYLEITKKLKTASKDVLERVLGYVDGVLDGGNIGNFELTEEQKESLRKIKGLPYSEHTDIDSFLNEMNKKYDI